MERNDEDLRREARLPVCCRFEAQSPNGVWSGVTEDVGPRGCRVVTAHRPRLGELAAVTLSTDLFDEPLETVARVAWAAHDRVGLIFATPSSGGGMRSPRAWLERLALECRQHALPGSPPVDAVSAAPRGRLRAVIGPRSSSGDGAPGDATPDRRRSSRR